MSELGHRRRLRGLGVLLSLVGAITPSLVANAAEGVSEDAVKAVFLVRFAGYVEWPPSQRSHFTIETLGADGIADELQHLLPKLQVKGLPAQLRRIRRISELGDAQILFVGRDAATDLRLIVTALAARPVLLVTENEHGLDLGSALNFLLVDQRVRFEVSVLAAERCGLRISSDLLAVAARVQGGRRTSELICPAGGAPAERRPACAVPVDATAAAISAGARPPRPVSGSVAASTPGTSP